MKMKRNLTLALILAIGISAPVLGEDPATDEKPKPANAELKAKVVKSLDAASTFLKKSQNAEGGYFGPKPFVGVTAIAVYALAKQPDGLTKHREAIDKGVEFLLKHRQEDGSITIPKYGYLNYDTSTSILALAAVDGEKYKAVIEKARDFEIGLQRRDEGEQKGSIGYGSSKDLGDISNQQFAMEALFVAGVKPDSEVMKLSVDFLSRVQNNSETNDLEKTNKEVKVGDDGGFPYGVGRSKRDPKIVNGRKLYPSYGSMTYAALKSFIYAGVDKDDRRVQAAIGWISRNYTLDENPGLRGPNGPRAAGQQGLFYYYMTFAKALDAYGKTFIEDEDGTEHHWAADISEKLLSIQSEDGSWINAEDRWMEKDPTYVTSISIIALAHAHPWLDKE